MSLSDEQKKIPLFSFNSVFVNVQLLLPYKRVGTDIILKYFNKYPFTPFDVLNIVPHIFCNLDIYFLNHDYNYNSHTP